MGVEIERKFLVDRDKWHQQEKEAGTFYRQGYIVNETRKNVRIRVSDEQAYITLKGGTKGISRLEYEYEIPVTDGNELLENFADTVVEKTRYRVLYAGKVWEVDEFTGENEGLIMAEIELKNEAENVEFPSWLLEEVTGDERYYNSYLVNKPFKTWTTLTSEI
ncbi:MAG TPA: CYTH domain-containing protein [Chitinophagaceae bacterium]|jgi:CYTH domain-containing protein|nr:CYTH domain-containing protein [Chitinophagaceae bacterium]